MIELLGYMGSLLVVVSMLMRSVTRLRVINTVGCAISAAYAVVIQAFPTVMMNVVLVVINGYYLLQMRKNAGSSAEGEPAERWRKDAARR